MPLYALDPQNQIISAQDANLFERYRCLECKKDLKKRFGKYRRPHFYHLKTSLQCRLYSRSIDHLVLQTKLQALIPALQIEQPFPSILRIADLLWKEQKLVFEIQCSPIAPSEVRARNRDYRHAGYEVVWLLDDRLFNKKRLRLAEDLLRSSACYFFSFKRGMLYDQFEIIHEKMRLYRGPQLQVDLSRPRSPPKEPSQLQPRGGRCFFGDLATRLEQNPKMHERLQETKQDVLKKIKKEKRLLFWIKKYFYLALEYLLKRSCEDRSLRI